MHSNDVLDPAAAASDSETDQMLQEEVGTETELLSNGHTNNMKTRSNGTHHGTVTVQMSGEEKTQEGVDEQAHATIQEQQESLLDSKQTHHNFDQHATDKPANAQCHDEETTVLSSVWGCAINLSNAIMGAGCIGYGGAMAHSGGFVTIALITFFALLSKWSFDLVLHLVLLAAEQKSKRSTSSLKAFSSSDMNQSSNTRNKIVEAADFEALAIDVGSGQIGLATVIASKGLYAMGCLVAYVVIVKDNLALGVRGMMDWIVSSSSFSIALEDQELHERDEHQELIATLVVCTTIMLPLSLLRNVSLLQRFSSAKIFLYAGILGIIIYLFVTLPRTMPTTTTTTTTTSTALTFYEKWLKVKPGIFQNTGTIVLAFMANIFIFCRSLRPQHRNMRDWRKVTSISITLSYVVFLGLALFAYMTYWDDTTADLFLQYPVDVPIVSLARVFLSVSMLFTYPMPMFALREIVALCLFSSWKESQTDCVSAGASLRRSGGCNSVDQSEEVEVVPATKEPQSGDPDKEDETRVSVKSIENTTWLQHVLLTVVLWLMSMAPALTGASLGQVLNLIGCVCGSLIGFILPGIFSMKLQGITMLGSVFLLVGGFVAIVGTWFSVRDIIVGEE